MFMLELQDASNNTLMPTSLWKIMFKSTCNMKGSSVCAMWHLWSRVRHQWMNILLKIFMVDIFGNIECARLLFLFMCGISGMSVTMITSFVLDVMII